MDQLWYYSVPASLKWGKGLKTLQRNLSAEFWSLPPPLSLPMFYGCCTDIWLEGSMFNGFPLLSLSKVWNLIFLQTATPFFKKHYFIGLYDI